MASLTIVAAITAVALGVRSSPASAVAEAVAAKEPPSVVVLVFDELPLASLMDGGGSIDPNLFPNFARLQRESTWFRNATTVEIFTKTVVPSILSGRRPSASGATSYGPDLFQLLNPTHALRTTFGSHPLCGVGLCETGVSTQSANVPVSTELFAAGPRGRDFASFLRVLHPDRGPGLYYLHLVMPHSPWRYLPSGQRYPSIVPTPGEWDPPGAGRAWGDDGWLVTQAQQRHLLQVGFVDHLLGILLERLEAAGVYDDALVIALADHGIAFRPGFHKRVVARETLSDVAAVPLFVKRPRGEGAGVVSDEPVELIDVLPTIADAVDVEIPSSVEGRSLFAPRERRSGIREIRGLRIDDRGKYRVVETKYRRFARDGETVDPFAIGPGNSEQLLGRRVTELDLERTRTSASVPGLKALETTNPDNELFPALLQGDLRRTKGRSVVAIAVNGRIAAVTRAFVDRWGQTRFYALLPPHAFHLPPNDVDLYEVEGPATLSPLL